ncbi:PLP-dependent aminotransferase family protein [Brevibacterium album]|uniref:MocR-like transcription factor YczR n=1 Tax=Brevibacterium album TaxID=417948 RepID=UPI00041800E7|nr:PLP-dependent aminotransferase family protein [Brevibacterium album]
MNAQRISPVSLVRALGAWGGDGPLHRCLTSRLRLLVLDGRLPLDARLPSERALSEALGVSRTTVATAYDALRESGYARSRRGSGTVVALPGPVHAAPAVPGAEGMLDLGRASLPAAALVPEAVRAAAEELPRYLPDSGYDGRGLPHLRAEIAGYYSARGLPTDPAQVLVTLGAQHAIHLLAQVLVRPGDRALLEAPTYPHALDALRAARARVLTMPVAVGPEASSSADGWDVESGIGTLRRARPALAYLMPDLHNPTGATMPSADRERLVAAAAEAGTAVLSDETTALLRLEAQSSAEAALPRPLGAEGNGPGSGGGRARGAGGVVHIGSAGKLFWGGLRVGWIRADRGLIERLVAARTSFDLGTPVVEQLAVALLLRRLPEVLAERAGQLSAGARALARLSARHLPDWEVPEARGGLTVWARLPHPASSSLALAAHARGVLLPAGPRFGPDGAAFERFVRMPLTAGPKEWQAAMPALAAAWQEACSGGVPPRQRPLPDVVV